jgi:hypothetical protein
VSKARKIEDLEDRVARLEAEINKPVRTINGFWDILPSTVPTLSGKVDAVIEHLGIEVETTPEKRAGTVARVTKKGKK